MMLKGTLHAENMGQTHQRGRGSTRVKGQKLDCECQAESAEKDITQTITSL